MRKSIGNQAVEAPPQSGLSQLLKANQRCMVYPLWRQEEDNSAHSARRRRQRAEGRELQRTSTWSAYLNTVCNHSLPAKQEHNREAFVVWDRLSLGDAP